MGGKRKRENKRKKEERREVEEEQEVSEDYCFACKDGGLLIVCDHKECAKAYHLECARKEESAEDEDNWICRWHTCLICKKNSKYQCYCCPNAVCQRCYKDTAFARVRGDKGFCHDCLRLAMLREEGIDVDSDGEKVDFKDQETYEGLFKEYWDVIKEKEGLILEDLHNADVQIQKGENYAPRSHKSDSSKIKSHSDSEDYVTKEEEEVDKGSSSDDCGNNEVIQPTLKKTEKGSKRPRTKRKGCGKIEFLGWASKALMEFLAYIGVDASKKLSQEDVASLINKYVQENKLCHPQKKKLVICDVHLQHLMGRKSFSMYKINDALEPHFAENLDQSDDEGYSSGYEEVNASLSTKKEAWWRKDGSIHNKGSLMEKFQLKEAISKEPIKNEAVVVKVAYSCFATIGPKNMDLVYLRRNLVEQLLEKHETFESKVVGSFVKVKSDPLDSKRPYQLLPVTGVKDFGDGNKNSTLLQVSSRLNDVPLSWLSNDDLSEDDCENLRQKVDNGLVEKPTVVGLEEKAKCLHEDITKHWIARELSVLRHRIDLFNEKGRRAELYEYRKRRDLLQSEEEQARMLNEVPKVIADVIEINPASEESTAAINLSEESEEKKRS